MIGNRYGLGYRLTHRNKFIGCHETKVANIYACDEKNRMYLSLETVDGIKLCIGEEMNLRYRGVKKPYTVIEIRESHKGECVTAILKSTEYNYADRLFSSMTKTLVIEKEDIAYLKKIRA